MTPLAPVVSLAVPRGRYTRLPLRTEIVHPLLTAAAAALAIGCVAAFGLSLRALVASLFCLALVVVTATDLEYRIIPNRVVGPASALVLAGMTAAEPSPQWAIGAVGASAFLFVLALVNPKGMGMGDVKLAFLMGAALGRAVPAALVVASLAALAPSLAVLVRHGSAGRKVGIPFAPFLALGSVVALFAGGPLVDTYLGG